MEQLAVIFLVAVLGGGALLVGLILAIVTGSARSARIRRLDEDQQWLRDALREAYRRVDALDQGMMEAHRRLAALGAERRRLFTRPPRRAPIPQEAPSAAPQAIAEGRRTHPFGEPSSPPPPFETPMSIPGLAAHGLDPVLSPESGRPTHPFGEPSSPPPSLEAFETLAAVESPETAADQDSDGRRTFPFGTLPPDEAVLSSGPRTPVLAHGAPVSARQTLPFGPPASPDSVPPNAQPTGASLPLAGQVQDPLPSASAHPRAAGDEVPAVASLPTASPPWPSDATPIAGQGGKPPSAAPPASSRPDWERWIGVRGAAAAGALILVIAGLYFFKYSIEQGLISPVMRVAIGVMVGAMGVAGSEAVLRRRDHAVLANWLTGAGVAILYTALWAAHSVYTPAILGTPVTFALMAVVTAICGLLAARNNAMAIALLGLAGGFATPGALSSHGDHPFGLFGYLLLLDAALLYLAHKRRWPILTALSLLATFVYEAGWIGLRMGPGRVTLGVCVVLVFAAAFGLALPTGEPTVNPSGRAVSPRISFTQGATVFLPFGFGLYLGISGDFGPHIYPVGALLVLLSLGAAWIGRARRSFWMSPAAAIASVAVVGTWMLVHDAGSSPWEVLAVLAALALVFHAFLEIEEHWPREALGPGSPAAALRAQREKAPAWPWIATAAAVATLGAMFLVLAAAVGSAGPPWPWIGAFIALGALALRQSLFEGRAVLRPLVGLLTAVGFPAIHGLRGHPSAFPIGHVHLAALLPEAGLVLLSTALLSQRSPSLSPPISSKPSARPSRSDQVSILLPFVFAVYFAGFSEPAAHLYPMALLLAVLAASAAFVARAHRGSGWLAPVVAAQNLVVLLVWVLQHELHRAPWEVAGLVVAVAAVSHVFIELPDATVATVRPPGITSGAATAALGSLGVLVIGATTDSGPPWPWIAGWALVVAIALRQASFGARAALNLGVAVGVGLGLPLTHGVHADASGSPSATVYLGLAVAAAVVVVGVASLRRDTASKTWAGHSAATLSLLLLVDALIAPPAPSPVVFGATIALALIALISASRMGNGLWVLAAALSTAFVHTGWIAEHLRGATPGNQAIAALAGLVSAVVVFTGFPILAGPSFRDDRWAFRASALAGPLWFAASIDAFDIVIGHAFIGVLPLAYGGIALAAAAGARRLFPDRSSPVRTSALAWLVGVALCGITVAIPLQLEKEWITIGWAVEGAALVALFTRIDHAGLKYFGLAHLAAATARLGLNADLLAYHPRSPIPILNWLLYTYWVPVAALFAAHVVLSRIEVSRKRSWEKAIYRGGTAVFSRVTVGAAIALLFLWLNLTIFDAFGHGSALTIPMDRLPARDLTLSLAWAIYALILLAAGMVKASAALRWTSLALIVVTVGKVFLYDLSHLRDLYRVVSLVGLAFSLILVSLAYQRVLLAKRDPR